MADEYWATFSVIDHRSPVYKQSLALFDRIVVPIPSRPLEEQTQEEIDQLSAEVDFLQYHDAAVRYEWNSSHFEAWRRESLNVSLSASVSNTLSDDPYYNSRLMLSDEAPFMKPDGVETVLALPVFDTAEKYRQTVEECKMTPETLNIEIFKRMPVPSSDWPLEEIIRLRNRPSFQRARIRLQDWQSRILPEIMGSPNSEVSLRKAMNDFDTNLSDYRDEMDQAGRTKQEAVICSVMTLGAAVLTHPLALATLVAAVPTFFKLRSTIRPSWKQVAEKNCSIAAVVYEAEQAIG